MLTGLTHIGHSPETVFRGSRIDLDDLRQPSGTFSQEKHFAMVRHAIAVTGRSDLGLVVGSRIGLVDHGMLGLLVSVSSTLRLAIERALRFISIVDVLWDWRLDLDGARPTLILDFPETLDDDLKEYFLDEFLGSFLNIGRVLPEPTSWIEQVDSRFAPTRDRIEKGRRHGLNFRFGRPTFCVYFDAAQLGTPLVNADPELAASLERQCEEMIVGLTDNGKDVDRVRRIILDSLPVMPKAGEIAKRMNKSERTLRRICETNGTSIRDIILDIRMTAAVRHMETTDLSLEEISFLVGYASPTAFFRSFKAWHGETPAEMRRKVGRVQHRSAGRVG